MDLQTLQKALEYQAFTNYSLHHRHSLDEVRRELLSRLRFRPPHLPFSQRSTHVLHNMKQVCGNQAGIDTELMFSNWRT
jgi:hypothetical protein